MRHLTVIVPVAMAIALIAFQNCNSGTVDLVGKKTNSSIIDPPPPPVDHSLANAWTALSITPENTHVTGGGGCPNGQQIVATVADCGLGTCSGNQNFCKATATAQIGDMVITDFYMSAENVHVVGGEPCPASFEYVGSIADCGDGFCFGNQVFCVQKEALATGLSAVTSLYLSAEGAHVPGGGGCPNGLQFAGTVTDCGGGTCSGNQVLCVGRTTAP